MRILQVITSLDIGGAETLVVHMISILRQKGHVVDLCVFNGKETPLTQRLKQLSPNTKIYALGRGYYNPLYILKLIRIIRNYDIVHTHNSSPQLFVAMASLFHRPILCSTEHNTFNRKRQWKWFHPIESWMYNRYQHVICISEIAEQKLRAYLERPTCTISTINNGIDVEKFHHAVPCQALVEAKADRLAICMIAAFRRQKDQTTLVRAMSLLDPKKFELWLVGEGDCMEAVRNETQRLGLESCVKFLGWRMDIANILRASDVVVMSSHWEGLSLSSVEGMSVGKPFVASNVNGLKEVVEGAGLLVEQGDAQALARVIQRLYDDRAFYQQVAESCYARSQQFDIYKTVDGYAAVYQHCMAQKQRKKLIRVTTADISLDGLLKGQLRFLNQYFNVIGVAKDTGMLHKVGEQEGITTVDAPLERPISLLKDIWAIWFLYCLFRREKPWCVHANTPKGSLLAMTAAWFARVPHRIYTVTGLRYQGSQGLFRALLKNMERLTCCFANVVIPEGQGVLRSLQRDGITGKPLQVIWNGNINGKDTHYLSRQNTVETGSFVVSDGSSVAETIHLIGLSQEEARDFIRKKLGLKADDFVFVFVGRVTNDKGMRELARALLRLESMEPTAKLLLVGELEGETDVVDAAELNYLMHSKTVIYAGVQADVRPYFMAADVLVFPSYREGFPNVPMEAGSMELPCIVTNINGSNEIIKEGVNGKIISAPLNDRGQLTYDITNDLYEAMLWFVQHPEEAKSMGAKARPMIVARYEQHDVWKALLKMYNNLDLKKHV